MSFTDEEEAKIRRRLIEDRDGEPKVEVPWPATSPELGGPTQAWLSDLNLLENRSPGDQVTWVRTPFDKQAITAGVTSIAKVAVPGVTLSGAVGAVIAYFQGWGASTTADWVLLSCATVLIAVTILAVALIVRADLAARSLATAALYQARADAAGALLRIIKPSEHVDGDKARSSGRGPRARVTTKA